MDIAFDGLIQLQHVDSDINALNARLEAFPLRLAAVEEEIKAAAESVSRAKDRLAANQKKRRELEGEVKSLRETIAKYKRQQGEVKTNKEYDAIKKEIAETQARIDAIEEAILGEMLAADDIEKEIKAAQKKQAEEEVKLRTDRETVLRDRQVVEGERAGLAKQREVFLTSIPPDQVRLYHRIAKKLAGVALSPVTDDFCSICQVRVRPQMLDELTAMKELITCEACGRILYWAKPKDEKAPGPVRDDPDRLDRPTD